MKYEEQSILERRAFSSDGKCLTFQHRNLWGTLTVEFVVPLADLRPELSRTWIRDEKIQQLVGVGVLIAYAAGTAYGVSREGEAAWQVLKIGMALSLLVAAAALIFVTRRYENAMIYYRTGDVAATIGRRGPEAAEFVPFLEELTKQIRASGPSSQDREPSAG